MPQKTAVAASSDSSTFYVSIMSLTLALNRAFQVPFAYPYVFLQTRCVRGGTFNAAVYKVLRDSLLFQTRPSSSSRLPRPTSHPRQLPPALWDCRRCFINVFIAQLFARCRRCSRHPLGPGELVGTEAAPPARDGPRQVKSEGTRATVETVAAQ